MAEVKRTTRFAPSPTGRMHAGNIFAALISWLAARSCDGDVVLRIDDIDVDRSKAEFATQVQKDFELLGLTWDRGPFFEHDNIPLYEQAYNRLADVANVYPCFCTRADLKAVQAPHFGDLKVYPGTCRNLSASEREARQLTRTPSWRIEADDTTIAFDDVFQGLTQQKLDEQCGDFVIRRSDGAYAYQLACVVDDHVENVTHVVRGIDLLSSTPRQIWMGRLLGHQEPSYAHIPILCAPSGRRLSKRDRDASLDIMLSSYGSPEGIIGHIAFVTALIDHDEAVRPEDLIAVYDEAKLQERWSGSISITWS